MKRAELAPITGTSFFSCARMTDVTESVPLNFLITRVLNVKEKSVQCSFPGHFFPNLDIQLLLLLLRPETHQVIVSTMERNKSKQY